MEKNIATMQATLKKNGLESRPHSKTHKCAAIAKYQLKTGSIGICCAKLTEAEAMAANGVDKILMTTCESVEEQDPPGDGAPEGAPELHPGRRRGAERAGPVGRREGGRCRGGCRDRRRGRDAQRHPAGEGALALAQLIDKLPNLKLRGILSYDGGGQHTKGFATRKERALRRSSRTWRRSRP